MKNKTLRTNSMKLKKVIAASLAISVLFAFIYCQPFFCLKIRNDSRLHQSDRLSYILRIGYTPDGLVCLLPVSYTHLDVYKRQMMFHITNMTKVKRIITWCNYYLITIREFIIECSSKIKIFCFISCLLYTSRCV